MSCTKTISTQFLTSLSASQLKYRLLSGLFGFTTNASALHNTCVVTEKVALPVLMSICLPIISIRNGHPEDSRTGQSRSALPHLKSPTPFCKANHIQSKVIGPALGYLTLQRNTAKVAWNKPVAGLLI
jgi:hypothetical protein